jgi:hypothetical protein
MDTQLKDDLVLPYFRIHAINMSFTLSPVGQKPLPGPLKLLYPSVNTTGDDTVIMVIHWNPGISDRHHNFFISHCIKDETFCKRNIFMYFK